MRDKFFMLAGELREMALFASARGFELMDDCQENPFKTIESIVQSLENIPDPGVIDARYESIGNAWFVILLDLMKKASSSINDKRFVLVMKPSMHEHVFSRSTVNRDEGPDKTKRTFLDKIKEEFTDDLASSLSIESRDNNIFVLTGDAGHLGTVDDVTKAIAMTEATVDMIELVVMNLVDAARKITTIPVIIRFMQERLVPILMEEIAGMKEKFRDAWVVFTSPVARGKLFFDTPPSCVHLGTLIDALKKSTDGLKLNEVLNHFGRRSIAGAAPYLSEFIEKDDQTMKVKLRR